jgi:hypothetical protein
MAQMNITLSELKMFKKINTDILPDLVKFIDTSKPQTHWKHYDNPTNFMTTNKKVKNDDEKLTMSIRGSLNKIFDANFNIVIEELKSLLFENKEQLEILVNLFFKKVVTEKNNIPLYIDVTKELFCFSVTIDNKRSTFRSILLLKCHAAFNNIMATTTNSELDGNYFKFKDETITFMKYLGELYNNKILSSAVIKDCMATILEKVDANSQCLYNIDIMCALFDTIKFTIQQEDVDVYELLYSHFTKIKDSKFISKKEKFMIMDIMDKCKA